MERFKDCQENIISEIVGFVNQFITFFLTFFKAHIWCETIMCRHIPHLSSIFHLCIVKPRKFQYFSLIPLGCGYIQFQTIRSRRENRLRGVCGGMLKIATGTVIMGSLEKGFNFRVG